jgi:hypothetical protein
MTLSPTLRWMLLLTVAVSVFEFFQGDAPAPSGSATNGAASLAAAPKPTRATQPTKAADPTALADAAWPLRLPDPRESDWPRQKLASSYGWEPAAALPPPKQVASKPIAVVLAPPPAPPVPQGPPPAPPFPYQMVGLLEQDGSTSAWLTSGASGSGVGGGGSTRTVVPEQVLDGLWRVGAISPRGLSVTWLETGQTLQIKYAP